MQHTTHTQHDSRHDKTSFNSRNGFTLRDFFPVKFRVSSLSLLFINKNLEMLRSVAAVTQL